MEQWFSSITTESPPCTLTSGGRSACSRGASGSSTPTPSCSWSARMRSLGTWKRSRYRSYRKTPRQRLSLRRCVNSWHRREIDGRKWSTDSWETWKNPRDGVHCRALLQREFSTRRMAQETMRELRLCRRLVSASNYSPTWQLTGGGTSACASGMIQWSNCWSATSWNVL